MPPKKAKTRKKAANKAEAPEKKRGRPAKKKERAKKKKTEQRIPWEHIKLRYITGDDKPSYRILGKEFHCAYPDICIKAKKEGWKELREQHHNNVLTKSKQIIEDGQTDDIVKYVESLKRMAERLDKWAAVIPPNSLEGISKELREITKQLEKYLGGNVGQMAYTVEERAAWKAWMARLREKDTELFTEFARLAQLEDNET